MPELEDNLTGPVNASVPVWVLFPVKVLLPPIPPGNDQTPVTVQARFAAQNTLVWGKINGVTLMAWNGGIFGGWSV